MELVGHGGGGRWCLACGAKYCSERSLYITAGVFGCTGIILMVLVSILGGLAFLFAGAMFALAGFYLVRDSDKPRPHPQPVFH